MTRVYLWKNVVFFIQHNALKEICILQCHNKPSGNGTTVLTGVGSAVGAGVVGAAVGACNKHDRYQQTLYSNCKITDQQRQSTHGSGGFCWCRGGLYSWNLSWSTSDIQPLGKDYDSSIEEYHHNMYNRLSDATQPKSLAHVMLPTGVGGGVGTCHIACQRSAMHMAMENFPNQQTSREDAQEVPWFLGQSMSKKVKIVQELTGPPPPPPPPPPPEYPQISHTFCTCGACNSFHCMHGCKLRPGGFFVICMRYLSMSN